MTDLVGRGVLLVETDASGVSAGMAQATKAVDKFEKSAVGAANKVGDAMSKAGSETTTAAGQMDAATKRFLASLEREAVTLEKGRVGWLEYKAAKMGASQESSALIARMRAAENQVGNLGMSAKQTTAAMRMLPAQITDIVTGLASGQPAYLVAIQQGGQLKDSFGGVVPAAKALAGVFTPLRIAIGAGVGAVGALIAAYALGAREADAYNNALIMTGNVAGMTAGQLNQMAANIDMIAGTQAGAAEALAALAGTGQVASGSIEKIGLAVVQMNRLAGRAVGDTVKEFEALGKSPVEASLKLNETYRYLTGAIYDQIKALQEQGREAEAAALAQQSFAEAMLSRTGQIEQNLGTIERAWNGIKSAASEAWDAMLSIGRQVSPEQALAAAEAQLAMMKPGGASFGRFAQQEITDQERLVESLRAQAKAAADKAKAEGDENTRQQARIKAQALYDKAAEASLSKQAQMMKALAEHAKQRDDIIAGGGKVDPVVDARIEASIRERFRDKSSPKAFRDDAATRMMQQLRETEAVLKAQLEGEEKIGAAAKKRIEFEQQIADLKTKGTLTAEQKSLLANEEGIRAQLEKNEILEKEISLRELIAKKLDEQAKAEQRFRDQAAGIVEGLAGGRESRREQFDRQLGAFGLGDRAREEIAAQTAIYREHDRARARLADRAAKEGTPLDSEDYRQAVDKIKTELSLSLAEHAAYFARLRELQGNWQVGAQRALANYIDDTKNVAGQVEGLFIDAFHGMEDALTDFVTTGKADWASLEQTILAGINRIIIQQQIMQPLAEWMKGSTSGGGGFAGVLGSLLGTGGGGIGAGTAGSAAATAFVSDGAGNLIAALAKGGLVGPSGIDMFANGGIVTEPTMFGHGGGLGQMGEAGYEAVMPVARGADGKLGVKAQGGGRQERTPNVFNFYVKDAESVVRSQGQLKAAINGWSAGGRRFQ